MAVGFLVGQDLLSTAERGLPRARWLSMRLSRLGPGWVAVADLALRL